MKKDIRTPNNPNTPNDVCTLRDVVKSNSTYAQRFSEAEDLAESIFKKNGDYVPLPYFTEHGKSHCEAVEKYLDQIIWGLGKPGEHDFIPTPEEATYLLSAVWLHDIGMMYKIFDDEDAEDLQDDKKVEAKRREHEFRTARYIHDKWIKNCGWSEDEKTCLSNICVYHRRHNPISTFDPAKIISKYDGRPVRLVVLAALLRLADACHEDRTRAPHPLMELYMSLGMPQEAVKHWERAKLISEVHFDHMLKRITLIGQCPPVFNFDLGSFDLQEILEIVRQDVEEELQSVQKVLLSYPNTSFWEVKHEVHYVTSLKIHEEKQYLAVWPYLLGKPSGSTEASAALVQMLLFAVKRGEKTGNFGEAWRNNIFTMMDETEKSHRVDFMIRNLRQKVAQILSVLPPEAKSADELTSYLENFSRDINENCRKMAECAQELVGTEDILMVYGYCANIVKFLENVGRQHNKSLYIVEYRESMGKTSLAPDENVRMLTYANKLGFEQVRFLPLPTVAEALSELTRKNSLCKLLLGAHGVLKTKHKNEPWKVKSFLCRVGSYMLASTAQMFDGRVIAFAEQIKFLTNGESDEKIAAPKKLFSWEPCKQHAAMIGTKCPSPPTIDFVPKKLVDLVVTEKGVFKPDDVPIPVKSPVGGLRSGKKDNNPA